MDIPGLGQKSLEEVRSRLADKGWTLAGDDFVEAGEDGEALLGDGLLSDEPETALLGGDLFDAGSFSDEE
jgi:hypothetical protein